MWATGSALAVVEELTSPRANLLSNLVQLVATVRLRAIHSHLLAIKNANFFFYDTPPTIGGRVESIWT